MFRDVSLRSVPVRQRWLLLSAASATLVAILISVQLSAAVLVGSMLAAIGVAACEGKLQVPPWPYRIAQGVIGCLIARSITSDMLGSLLAQWPVFLGCIASVIFFSTSLGGLLARFEVLPGTTAVWGSAPGAASAMTLMSESFGGDARLVAFMQYLRVVFVTVAASLVSRLWAAHGGAAHTSPVFFAAVPIAPLCATVALAVLGAIIGTVCKLPAGALLVPMFGALLTNVLGAFPITLPAWLLAPCYALVGWTIGLRFTREILVHVARAFGKVAASIAVLMMLCGGLAYVLHVVTGRDALTSYLATSPGGADSVAIIAAAAKVDLPFVMTMQTARMLLVLIVGPGLARIAARRYTSELVSRDTDPALTLDQRARFHPTDQLAAECRGSVALNTKGDPPCDESP